MSAGSGDDALTAISSSIQTDVVDWNPLPLALTPLGPVAREGRFVFVFERVASAKGSFSTRTRTRTRARRGPDALH